jgi:nickel-dependent lactate racemase
MTDSVAVNGEVLLPWAAWDRARPQQFAAPADWRIQHHRMHSAPALTESEIESAFDAPVGAPPLGALAAGRISAAIAIDDATRPTRTAALLGPIVNRLLAAGISLDNLTVLVATGAHRPATPREIELKVGRELLTTVRVVSHDPVGDLVDTGVQLGGVPVRINRRFAEADVRIGVGAVLPHPFAGFSGGGKIVIPGLADLDVLVRTHKYALMGLSGGAQLEGNRFRTEMEAAVRRIGLHWTVNVAVNAECETAHLSVGDMVAAHRQAAGAARRIGMTPAPVRRLDGLILNAYPKDTELLQIEAAFVALRNGIQEWLSPEAPILLTAACSEGMGYHGLFGAGGRLARKPGPRTFLGRHPLLVFSPNVSRAQAQTVFWEGYPFFERWSEASAAFAALLPASPLVGMIPCGPLQIAAARASADGHRSVGCL